MADAAKQLLSIAIMLSDAINDDWRVVKFPEMALIRQEDKTFGIGCEFVLEKIA